MAIDEEEIRPLLEAWSGGDTDALDQLFPLVFDDLHRMARFFFQRESDTHTLQPTALLSEIYFRLRGQRKVQLESSADFFNFAAEVLRHFLVDYARKRKAEKRGSGQPALPLDESFVHFASSKATSVQLLDLNRALKELEEVDPRLAKIVTLRFILGLHVDEVAQILGKSQATVKRWSRIARAWLKHRLEVGAEKRGDGDDPTDPESEDPAPPTQH